MFPSSTPQTSSLIALGINGPKPAGLFWLSTLHQVSTAQPMLSSGIHILRYPSSSAPASKYSLHPIAFPTISSSLSIASFIDPFATPIEPGTLPFSWPCQSHTRQSSSFLPHRLVIFEFQVSYKICGLVILFS